MPPLRGSNQVVDGFYKDATPTAFGKSGRMRSGRSEAAIENWQSPIGSLSALERDCRRLSLRANTLLQPPAQFRRIPRAVPDGQHFDFLVRCTDGKIDRVGPRRRHFGSVRQPSGKLKSIWVLRESFQKRPQRIIESQANTGLPTLIPVNCLVPLPLGLRLGNDPECHFLARSRFLISAETSSIGVPRPGCVSASSARRSSSAICSGVSSSSNLPRSDSKTSRCSSNGSLSICSNTWAALMATIYSFEPRAQTAFSPHLVAPHAPRPLPARIFQRQSGSADFQVCPPSAADLLRRTGCIAGFQTRERHARSTPCRFGNRRYSRFGNLRYVGFARVQQKSHDISGLELSAISS